MSTFVEPVPASGAARERGRVAAPLTLTGVTKRWSTLPDPVLNRVDLALDAGTLTWIGGANGAGKTTLLRIAAGLIRPDRGRVHAFGLDPVRDRREFARRVALLSAHSAGLYNRLRVRDHLNFAARIAMLPRSERPEAIRAAIDAFGVEPLLDRRSDRLSMGQRQRVRLAMTFLAPAGVLLLDEPLNSLDDDAAALLDGAVRDALDANAAVVWCSPKGSPPATALDRALVIDSGRLVPA